METSHSSSPRSRSHSPSKSLDRPRGDSGSSPLQPGPAAPKPLLPWFTESYFTSEPATAAARKKYIIILTLKILLVIVFLLSVLSIYWGSLWRTPAHTHNLNNWVVVSSPSPCSSWSAHDVNAYDFLALASAFFRTLTAARWAGSSRVQWSIVVGRQLRSRGA